MSPSPNDPLVPRAAALVLDAFEDYDARLGDLTRRARRRFEHRDWRGAQADAIARIDLQDGFLGEALGRFEALVGERPEAEARRAVLDYGQAITDLARSGIFPGDLLLKNFGVSRNGRALFYDFDELCLLEEVNFRDLPEAREEDETRPLEDWLYARPDDVFPALFPRFLGLSPPLRQALLDAHPGIFDAAWWRGVQAKLRAGGYLDVPPYPASARV